MAKTANLAKAKEKKNDEFYTQWADIQKEANAYLEFDPDTFRGKSVLLPCDDPEWSNFTKFFAQNFEAFGLRRLVSTSYAFASKKFSAPVRNRLGYWQPTLFDQTRVELDELLAKGVPALSGPVESRAIDAIPSWNNEIWEHN